MSLRLSFIGAFMLRTLAWFALALALWFWLGASLVQPSKWLSESIMLAAFPTWAYQVQQQGTQLILMTLVEVLQPDGRYARPSFLIDGMRFGFGFPLLAALFLATSKSGLWWKIPLGFALLVPVQAFGICTAWLDQVAIHAGHISTKFTQFSLAEQRIIVVAYQMGHLILPALAPVLVWLSLERQFFAALLMEASLTEFNQRKSS